MSQNTRLNNPRFGKQFCTKLFDICRCRQCRKNISRRFVNYRNFNFNYYLQEREMNLEFKNSSSFCIYR